MITCNTPEDLGPAFLRPGRGGELIEFPPPTPEERIELLKLYMKISKIPVEEFDLEALSSEMTDIYTHDWVRLIAEQAIIHDTQARLLAYIKQTNEKLQFIDGLDHSAWENRAMGSSFDEEEVSPNRDPPHLRNKNRTRRRRSYGRKVKS